MGPHAGLDDHEPWTVEHELEGLPGAAAHERADVHGLAQLRLEPPGPYPEIATESLLIDRAVMEFIRRPESFDVVVASNLFGDILTDLSAAVTGSIGLASSANINPERRFPSMFEPVHGSAPDIAGTGIANPLAAVLSAALMLDHLKEKNRVWAERMVAADDGFFKRLERQQAPEYLWIGCSDSRVPANEIVDLDPG